MESQRHPARYLSRLNSNGSGSNAPRENAELILRALQLEQRFSAIIISEELTSAKPHPLPYLTALAAVGGDAGRSVAFEDSPAGVKAAVAAGLGVAGLLTSVDSETLLNLGVGVVARDFSAPGLLAFVYGRTGHF